ncbi:MAG: hypothetical protein JW969_02615 [Spirochaetales bacterium]|nr:hypothetical protein [Spirochaetales bacterium]
MLRDDWKNMVMYQILPRVFRDSNGDGIGDLNGIIEKLDYLKGLGVGGIWLMPFYRTHGADEGYDVEDYYTVRRQYGTNDDFKNLISECHKRKIKIIIDLVLNHTSNVHKWFLDDCLAGKKGKKESYYLWHHENPQWTLPYWWKIDNFQSWNRNPWKDDGMYYYSAFSKTQPDLNYNNPKVLEEVKKIVKYYLDCGVDGFRMDAVRYIVEEKKGVQADTEGTHRIWRELKKLVNKYDNRILMGECFTYLRIIRDYVGDEEFDTCVNFDFAYALKNTLIQESPYPLRDCIQYVRDYFPNHLPDSQFAVNHDEVNDRFATLLGGFMPKMKIGMALLILSCGIPYIYYGEEIGMPGKSEPTRRYLRKIMQWDDTPFAGFSDLSGINPENGEFDLDFSNCILGAFLDRKDNIRFWTKVENDSDEVFAAGTFNNFHFDAAYPLKKAEDDFHVSGPYKINDKIFEDDLFKFYKRDKKTGAFTWMEINPDVSRDKLALPDSNLVWDPTYHTFNYRIKFQTTGFKRPFMLNKGYKTINVKNQSSDPSSFFNFNKLLIGIKRGVQAFDYDAAFQFIDSEGNNEKLFAFRKEKQGEEVYVIINLRNESLAVRFPKSGPTGTYTNLMDENTENLNGRIELAPYEIKILKKGKLKA